VRAPTVGRRRPSLDQAELGEAAQEATQIARVQLEVAGDLCRRRPVSVGELVEDAHLGH